MVVRVSTPATATPPPTPAEALALALREAQAATAVAVARTAAYRAAPVRRRRPTRLARRLSVVGSAGLVVLLVGGSASAFWSAPTATGQGEAAARTLSATVEASTAPVDSLVPGGTATVSVTVRNTSAVPVRLTAVTGTAAPTASSCTAPLVTFTAPAALPTDAIAPGASRRYDLAGAAAMGVDSPSACQGATITVPLRVQVTGA